MGMVVKGGSRRSDVGGTSAAAVDEVDDDNDSTLECNNMKARMPALLYGSIVPPNKQTVMR